MFSRRLPLPALIDLCRVLRHQLGAGLSLQQVLKRQSERGPRSVRVLAGNVSLAIQQGSNLSDALERETDVFPPLFLSLIKVGETTGHMAELFGELERYYQLELKLRRQFRSQTLLPIIQFVAAVFILAGVIFILGMIADMNNTRPLLTIFGLSGAKGSMAFLVAVFGSIFLAWSLFRVVSSMGRQKAWMDHFLLRVPALGSCLSALVMSRFTLALQLTLDSGLAITQALRLSLNATGNAYFSSRADLVVSALKGGNTLHDALLDSALFGDDFLNLVASSEASGRVPEMMRHQAEYYNEEASRRMKTLTMLSGMGVWACCAVFIIWAIFRLASIYLNALGA